MIVLLVLGVGLLSVAVASRLGPAPGELLPAGLARLAPEPAQGPAPALRLVQAAGGEVSLADLRGRALLLNFWATWCEPCLEELPHLAVLADALADLPVTLALVSVDERWEDVDALAARLEGAAPAGTGAGQAMRVAAGLLRGKLSGVLLLRDPGEEAAHALGTFKYPETWLIDPRGELRLRFVGAKAWGTRDAIAAMRGLLAAP